LINIDSNARKRVGNYCCGDVTKLEKLNKIKHKTIRGAERLHDSFVNGSWV